MIFAYPYPYHSHPQPWGTIVLGVLVGIPVLILLTVLVVWIKYRIDYRE